ncbi:CocE/NonD family hydrolase [Microbacterium sp. CFBP 8790]|uniref:CocE/NonD family hydrolase n=1 Tax=unclassified Microbacterium TaxID=2609290 RepID=UPI0017875B22|nr:MULTISPECIES: CocE/NonD family hydrolase [unclassified Microbacterium]MBD8207284.1 CocE/NonD family hydrolase [Microbacterium sp. CFBP 8801]MBD8508642.1 CocE/NonD family hydrolase [Microbacterium sp. CFBP 8790]
MRGRTAGLIVTSSVVMTLLWAGGASAATPDLDIAPTPAASIAPATPTTTTSASDVASGVTHAQNPSVPEGAVWTEQYLPSPAASTDGDPVELHADVLRPAHLPPDARTPVILLIGPYFSHSGAASDEHRPFTGPTQRHRALIDQGDLLAAGYTVVFVDLRGFGGSTGCLDFAGPGEQADVTAAVEWAASAAWSTGRVGMYGKSYDAMTGLMGVAARPAGLAAVVSQEPVWDPYSYLWENGIPTENNRATPEAYLQMAALPGIATPGHVDGLVIPPDTDRYRDNATYEKRHPECATSLLADTLVAERASPEWAARDLASRAEGSTVPLLFTQGWTERNTRADGLVDVVDGLEGPVSAWAGPWDHVAGNDVDSAGRLQMGRADWFGEVRAFFDAHLRDEEGPAPSFALQDNLGRWRTQAEWPGTTREVTSALAPAQYVDTGEGAGALPDGDDGDGSFFGTAPRTAETLGASQTLSVPVAEETRLTGSAEVVLQTRGEGAAHVRLWDVGVEGIPTLIDETLTPVDAGGTTSVTLRALDWTLSAGHAALLTVGTTDSLLWRPSPRDTTVTIDGGILTLHAQGTSADLPTAGDRAPFLDAYLADARWPVAIGAVAPSFSLADPVPSPTAATGGELARSGGELSPAAALWAIAALALGAALVRRRATRSSR